GPEPARVETLCQGLPRSGAGRAVWQAPRGHRAVPDTQGNRAGAVGPDPVGRGPGIRLDVGSPGERFLTDSYRLSAPGRGPGQHPCEMGRLCPAAVCDVGRPAREQADERCPVPPEGGRSPGICRPSPGGSSRPGTPPPRGRPVVVGKYPRTDPTGEAVC